MTTHAALERLSALVDGEVSAPERDRLASHLAACPECRHRLDGLRAVAQGLSSLERARSPRALDLALADLARPGETRRRRSGLARLDALGTNGPLILPLAAVLGLALMLFALVAYRAASFGEGDGPPQPRILRLQPSPFLVDGVELIRQGNAWRERSSVSGAAERPVRLATASEREKLLRGRPELAALARREELELWGEGEWLRLAPAALPEDADGGSGQDER